MKESFAAFIERDLEPRSLVITCGLPASYKTGVAEDILSLKRFVVLRSDLIRREVLKNEDVFDEKVAGNMNKRLSVYDEMFRRAEDLASKSTSGIILDATFVTQDLRERAAEIAAKHNMPFVILETSCPDEVALNRISKRTKEKYESNALTPEAYLSNKAKFEPVNVEALKKKYPKLTIEHLIIDTCRGGLKNLSIIAEEKR
ncbi:MAG: ATP-binding protein [Candidatus Bathyarchaeota archaeon]|nr:ATP-binding protein [Candidatus Bathyarchaeota archaeon]